MKTSLDIKMNVQNFIKCEFATTNRLKRVDAYSFAQIRLISDYSSQNKQLSPMWLKFKFKSYRGNVRHHAVSCKEAKKEAQFFFLTHRIPSVEVCACVLAGFVLSSVLMLYSAVYTLHVEGDDSLSLSWLIAWFHKVFPVMHSLSLSLFYSKQGNP